MRLVEAGGRPELDLALAGRAGGRIGRGLWATGLHLVGVQVGLQRKEVVRDGNEQRLVRVRVRVRVGVRVRVRVRVRVWVRVRVRDGNEQRHHARVCEVLDYGVRVLVHEGHGQAVERLEVHQLATVVIA